MLHARLVVGELEERARDLDERDHSDGHQLAICLAIRMAIRPRWWLARSRSEIKWSSSPNMAIRCNQMQSDLVVGEVEERNQVELLPKRQRAREDDGVSP